MGALEARSGLRLDSQGGRIDSLKIADCGDAAENEREDDVFGEGEEMKRNGGGAVG